jgi:hypothetical protein
MAGLSDVMVLSVNHDDAAQGQGRMKNLPATIGAGPDAKVFVMIKYYCTSRMFVLISGLCAKFSQSQCYGLQIISADAGILPNIWSVPVVPSTRWDR